MDNFNKSNNFQQAKRKKQGLLFRYNDEEFGAEKRKNEELIKEYNNTLQSEFKKRDELIKKIFASCGDNCVIETPFYTNYSGCNVYIGNSVYINFNLSLVDDGKITIGDHTLIGPNVTIITTGHTVCPNLRDKMYVKEVNIEENVWIGAGVIILPGVTIGKNSVIGAGSVVNKDIPENVVAVGSPCKVLRSINERDNEFFYKNEKIDWENL